MEFGNNYTGLKPRSAAGLFLAAFCSILFISCDLLKPEEDDGVLHTIAYSASGVDEDQNDVYMILEDGTVLVTVPGAGSEETYPQFHPTLQLLYFLSDIDGSRDIYSTDSAATGITRITEGVLVQNFIFSGNGETILFETYNEESSSYEIYRMDDDGTNLALVTAGRAPYFGKHDHVIFYTGGIGYGDLYLLNLNNGDEEAVVETGTATVYAIDRNKDRDLFLLDYRLPSGTTHNWQLVDEDGDALFSPQIPSSAQHAGLSDDGKWLCFMEYPEDGNDQQIVKADKNMASKKTLSETTLYKSAPQFYHDDFRVLYRAYTSSPLTYYLYTVSVDGGGDAVITPGYEDMDEVYAISPDGW